MGYHRQLRRSSAWAIAAAPALVLACVGEDPTLAPTPTEGDAGGGLDSPSASLRDAAEGGPSVSTVRGLVHDQRGLPLSGVSVAIGASTVTTDSTGAFTLDATPTYDLLVARNDGSSHVLAIYNGLSRRDPTVEIRTTTTVDYRTLFHGSLAGLALDVLGGNTWYALRTEGPSLSWGYASATVSTYAAASAPSAPYYGSSNGTGYAFVLQSASSSGNGPYAWVVTLLSAFADVDGAASGSLHAHVVGQGNAYTLPSVSGATIPSKTGRFRMN